MSVSIGIETKVAAVPAEQKVRAVLVIDEPDLTPFLESARTQLRQTIANLFSGLFKVRPYQLKVTFEDEDETEEPEERPVKHGTFGGMDPAKLKSETLVGLANLPALPLPGEIKFYPKPTE